MDSQLFGTKLGAERMLARLFGTKLFGDTPYGGTFTGSVADRSAGEGGGSSFSSSGNHDRGLAMNFRI